MKYSPETQNSKLLLTFQLNLSLYKNIQNRQASKLFYHVNMANRVKIFIDGNVDNLI